MAVVLKNHIRANHYADSVFLMSLANRATALAGVLEAAAMMGTPENKQLLQRAGLLNSDGQGARPDDLIIALRAEGQEPAERAMEQVQRWMAERLTAADQGPERPPRTLRAALERMPEANLVLISLPGLYAAWEAQTALKAGRHVMVFSDNVPIQDEVALKAQALEQGLLVMGPDCGTAILGGKVLGFGDVVRRGAFGIVGASGTGIQEVCSLLDRFDEGISHAIGLGGRDLSAQVEGASALQAIGFLEADAQTEVILFVSKASDSQVAGKILARLSEVKKPCVACFQGQGEVENQSERVAVISFLEDAVGWALRFREKTRDFLIYQSNFLRHLHLRSPRERARLGDEQRYVRGLFSGGSLCAEAGVILSWSVPEFFSNINLPGGQKLEPSALSRGHTLVDLGADEFTIGTPHPMIDFTARRRRFIQEAKDPQVAVILFDIVLGYGAHADPAEAILPAVLEGKEIAEKRGGYLCCVASLCGTRGDPQDLERQRQILEKNGVVVLSSAAQAARFSIDVALRERQTNEPGVLASGPPAAVVKQRISVSPQANLLNAPLQVINLGLPSFAESLRQQGVLVLHVDWRPPAGGDPRLMKILRQLD